MPNLSPSDWNAILLSLQVAGTGVLFSLPFGVALGWLLSRKRFYGKTLLETAIYLPLVLPPVVTGYLLLITFGRNGWPGQLLEQWLGVRLVFDWRGAALAAAIVSFPLMVRSIRSAVSSVDRRVEQAAQTLGARPWDAFCTVSLPLAMRGIVAGTVLAFARGLGEFGATIMIAGNLPGETQTIPLLVYDRLQNPGGIEQSGAVIGVSVLLAAVALLISEKLEQRHGSSEPR